MTNWERWRIFYEAQLRDEARGGGIDFVECACPPRGMEVETWPYYERVA
jgi:hypothetical protein